MHETLRSGQLLCFSRTDEIPNPIDRAGYEATITPPDASITSWSLRAEGYRVVGASTVEAFRAWFEHVATEFRGEYDGWEAASKP